MASLREDQVLSDVQMASEFAAGLTRLGDELRVKYGAQQDVANYMIDLFLGRVPLGIPDDLRFVSFDARSSRPADIIFRIIGALAGGIRLTYVPPSSSSKDRARAARVDAHLAALADWFGRAQTRNYQLQSLWWLLLTGRSYIQQSYLPHHWDREYTEPTEEEKENPAAYIRRMTAYKAKTGPPVLREVLDPRTVFPVYGRQGIRAWVKTYRVQRLEFEQNCRSAGLHPVYGKDGLPVMLVELEQLANLVLPEETTQLAGNLIYHEYIDDEYICYICNNRVIYSLEHKGSIRVFPALGLQTGLNDPEWMAVGVLWPVRNELPQLDFFRTLIAQKAYLDVFPPLIAELKEGESAVLDEAGNPREWKLAPGTIVQLPAQVRPALAAAPTSTDVLQIITYLAQEIDLATIPALMRGVAPQYQAGYSVNQMLAATRAHWKPFIQSLEVQEEALAEHYLTIVKEFVKQPVIVYGEVTNRQGQSSRQYITLNPDDIDDIPRVQARHSADLPVDRQATAQVFWNLFKEGGVTWADYVTEGLGRQDPENYRKQAERDIGRRQLFPAAMQAATALARVKLVNDLIKQRGLDQANVLLTADIESLLEGMGEGQEGQALAPGGPLPVNPALGQMPQARSGTPQLPGQAPNSLGPGSAIRR